MLSRLILACAVSLGLIIASVVYIIYVSKYIKLKKVLDDILYNLNGVDGLCPHDNLRIKYCINTINKELKYN